MKIKDSILMTNKDSAGGSLEEERIRIAIVDRFPFANWY